MKMAKTVQLQSLRKTHVFLANNPKNIEKHTGAGGGAGVADPKTLKNTSY